MISCAEYDAIEIVCMYYYPIRLTLKSGEELECKAMDTQRNPDGEECIKVKTEGFDHLIVLASISILEICVENPHFKIVAFL